MLIAVDIGNTNIVIGVFDEKGISSHWRLSTRKEATADEYAVMLLALFSTARIDVSGIDGSIISSVVPSVEETFGAALADYLGQRPLIVGPGVKTGMHILTDNPHEVGSDRIVNAVAAYSIYKRPCIIVDFGTAVTFDYVTAKGEYAGGAIAPGITLAVEALHQGTAKLPRIKIAKPRSVIGRNTVDSMRSGMYFGFASMVDGIVKRFKNEAGGDPMVVATGGAASLIAKGCSTIDAVDEHLTLKGLKLIYEVNNGHDH
ncbi:MAG: type III pantothenate kinase [Deltaproteobacteria bacterium]|nr:type III pantothenate kinase [Deltaproteobacteria bacterium]